MSRDEFLISRAVFEQLDLVRKARIALRRVLETTAPKPDMGCPRSTLHDAVQDYLGREHDAFAESELAEMYTALEYEDGDDRWVRQLDGRYGRTPLPVLAADVYGVTPADYAPETPYMGSVRRVKPAEAAE
jgi:hypothetical protein